MTEAAIVGGDEERAEMGEMIDRIRTAGESSKGEGES